MNRIIIPLSVLLFAVFLSHKTAIAILPEPPPPPDLPATMPVMIIADEIGEPVAFLHLATCNIFSLIDDLKLGIHKGMYLGHIVNCPWEDNNGLDR